MLHHSQPPEQDETESTNTRASMCPSPGRSVSANVWYCVTLTQHFLWMKYWELELADARAHTNRVDVRVNIWIVLIIALCFFPITEKGEAAPSETHALPLWLEDRKPRKWFIIQGNTRTSVSPNADSCTHFFFWLPSLFSFFFSFWFCCSLLCFYPKQFFFVSAAWWWLVYIS